MLFSREDLKRLIMPLVLEQILAVTIGMADTVMVAGVGEAAVSGVSLVDAINVLLINVFSALATGGAVLASQYLGRQDRENAGGAAKQLLYTVLAASLAIMGLCLALRDWLLDTIFGHIEADVMTNAQVYFFLSALSYPFLAVYNGSAALLRAMGNAKASFKTSMIINAVNVSGNALFIYGFGWGVMGAALATLIARMTGSVVMTLTLKNPHNLIPLPSLLKFQWRWDMVRGILRVGVPTGLENSFFQLGKLLLQRLISSFGTVGLAANAVANTLSTLQVIPGSAMGLAMITVVGRCAGAREYAQARAYVKRLMRLTYGAMICLNIPLLLLTPAILPAFALSGPTADLAYRLILTHALGSMVTWPASFTLPNALRAANDARFTMIVSSLSMAIFRIAFSYLLALGLRMGVLGVWVAMEIDWVFRTAAFVWRFHSGKWESKTLIQ